VHFVVLTPQASVVKEIFVIVSRGSNKPMALEEMAMSTKLGTGALQREGT